MIPRSPVIPRNSGSQSPLHLWAHAQLSRATYSMPDPREDTTAISKKIANLFVCGSSSDLSWSKFELSLSATTLTSVMNLFDTQVIYPQYWVGGRHLGVVLRCCWKPIEVGECYGRLLWLPNECGYGLPAWRRLCGCVVLPTSEHQKAKLLCFLLEFHPSIYFWMLRVVIMANWQRISWISANLAIYGWYITLKFPQPKLQPQLTAITKVVSGRKSIWMLLSQACC